MTDPNKHSGKKRPSSRSRGGVFNQKNKWLLWIGVVLMILAMIAYVMTLDESEVPGEGGEEIPAELP